MAVPCRLVTDEPCRSACAAALAGAGVAGIALDVVPLGGSVSDTIALWRRLGVTHALSIERCGTSADGAPRNMRGEDISAFTTLLDDLFVAGPWQRVAIGDGGNEIGMGSVPAALIGAHVAHGETIACATPADHLIAAGVSNWGAYALIGALAVLRPDWRESLLGCLDADLDRAILWATVYQGPAVDGVTRTQGLTVDSLEADVTTPGCERSVQWWRKMPEPHEFICEAYRFEPTTGTLALHYAFDTGVRFEERIVFPIAERQLSEQENVALDRIFRLLLLACGVSYYKAFAPDRITCRAFPLDPATVAFFTEFYVKGLAEFAYRNGIDLVSRLRIAADAIDAPSAIGLTLPRRTCVPVGGEDSIVTVECLKQGGEPLVLFSLGIADPIEATIRQSGVPAIHVTRRLDPTLFELNAAGALNGHVPITGILA